MQHIGIGRVLIIIGIVLVFIGFLIILAGRLNIPFGHLPGDITYQKKNLTVFAPFGTMLIISVIITVILNILSRWKH